MLRKKINNTTLIRVINLKLIKIWYRNRRLCNSAIKCLVIRGRYIIADYQCRAGGEIPDFHTDAALIFHPT